MSLERPEDVNKNPLVGEAHTDIAVGLDVTDANRDAVARALLRAHARGYQIFIADAGDRDPEVRQFTDALGAGEIEVHVADPTPGTVRQGLAAAAADEGYSHLIIHIDLATRIDYEQSLQQLEDDGLCVEAATGVGSASTETTPGVLVAIPAYNEANSIASVVKECQAVADEVLVVDDGSDDDTAALAADAGATVVEHNQNQGYGAALQTAFSEAHDLDAEHLVIIDADGQHDPADIPQLVETQQEEVAEVVIGSRFAGDGETDAPLYRRFGLGVVNTLTNLSLGVVRPKSRVKDTQSGFRAYDRTAIESLAASDDIGARMSASTDILYHAHDNDFDIEEIGTTITYDVESASSHNPVDHGITLVKNILYTIERKRPVTVLGVPGFLSSLVGIGFAYWTISNFLNSGTFSVGLALISSVFVLAGIFACFTGIILHALNTQVVHRLEDL